MGYKGHEEAFVGNGCIHYLDCSDGFTHVYMCQKLPVVHFNCVQAMSITPQEICLKMSGVNNHKWLVATMFEYSSTLMY